ncbi:MAG: HEAT repeat domain-containing protein [Methanomicrobia archaeon]|nr:HEAT repeat domain-containing protein [Methanomicrobia archaeon]
MIDQAEIHRKSESGKVEERREALKHLKSDFADLPDKAAAWLDLHRLTGDENGDVRWRAADALGAAFTHVPDKAAAWHDLHRLMDDEDCLVRLVAANALGATFPYVPDKAAAWHDLHRLANDEYSDVRLVAANALGAAFTHVPDKEAAWHDLHRLTNDEYRDVRCEAANALGATFPYVPDKAAAWLDLHRLTGDDARSVRGRTAGALGTAFTHVPDREEAWDNLHRLTGDEDSDVRVQANYALGRASILKATEAKTEEDFRKEIENALSFFEQTSHESWLYENPARFCLPFYRSFYMITFKKQEAEAEVQSYLAEAKNETWGSESKEKLLEAVENLADALREVQDASKMDFDMMKSDLKAYKQYCDRAADLLRTTEEKAPTASKLIKRGLPIINRKIQELLAEIDKKAKILCDAASGTKAEDYVYPTCKEVRELIKIRNEDELEKRVEALIPNLRFMGESLPEAERIFVLNKVETISSAEYLEDKLGLLNEIIVYVTPHIRLSEKIDELLGYVRRIESSCNQIIRDIEEKGVTLKAEDKHELKTLADDLKAANKEQLTQFAQEFIKLLEDPEIQQELEKHAPKERSRIKRAFSTIGRIANELGIAVSAAVTAEGLLPQIEAIMAQMGVISHINPALAAALILIPLVALKERTLK